MAYLTDDEKEDEQQNNEGGLLSGYASKQSTLTPQPLGSGMTPTPRLYGTQGSGPSATGHVNFDRIYAANEATADRDAKKMGAAAQGAASKARAGLGGLQQTFASQSANATGRAPTANDIARSKGAGTPFYTPPPSATAAGQSTFAQSGRAPQAAQIAPDTEANWLDSMKRQAGHSYGGPNSLQDVEGYSGLLKDYGAAGDALSGIKDDAHIQGALEQNKQTPHIEGGTRLDAALIGQAGRHDFANIREQNKGLPGEFRDALKSSAERGGQAGYEARVNAAKHGGLLDDYAALTAPKPEDDGTIRMDVAGDKTLGWSQEQIDAAKRNSMFTDGNPSTIIAKTFDDYGSDVQGLANALGISVEDAADALKNPKHKADIIAGRFTAAEVASRKAKGL